MGTMKTTSKAQRDAGGGKFVMPAKFPKITAWSFSVYRRYVGCPRQVALEKLLKEKMQNAGMSEGVDMHSIAEDYVGKKGKFASAKAKLPIQLKLVEDHAKALRADPSTEVELSLAFTKNWTHTGWFDKDTWVRIKVDARRILARAKSIIKVVEITDWKGGKANAFFDQQQAELYALGEFKNSGCKEVRTKFAHTETGDETDGVFTITEQASLVKTWDGRIKKMLNDERFDPKPSIACTWCPFRKTTTVNKRDGSVGNGICGKG